MTVLKRSLSFGRRGKSAGPASAAEPTSPRVAQTRGEARSLACADPIDAGQHRTEHKQALPTRSSHSSAQLATATGRPCLPTLELSSAAQRHSSAPSSAQCPSQRSGRSTARTGPPPAATLRREMEEEDVRSIPLIAHPPSARRPSSAQRVGANGAPPSTSLHLFASGSPPPRSMDVPVTLLREIGYEIGREISSCLLEAKQQEWQERQPLTAASVPSTYAHPPPSSPHSSPRCALGKKPSLSQHASRQASRSQPSSYFHHAHADADGALSCAPAASFEASCSRHAVQYHMNSFSSRSERPSPDAGTGQLPEEKRREEKRRPRTPEEKRREEKGRPRTPEEKEPLLGSDVTDSASRAHSTELEAGGVDVWRLRRVTLQAIYAQQCVAGGNSTGPDLSARCVAYLYAMVAGVLGACVGYFAGYQGVTTGVLVVHGMTAVAAAMWPPPAKPPGSRWMRQAGAWANRARARLVAGQSIHWHRRTAAAQIQAAARARAARTQYKSLKASAIRVQAGFRGYLCRRGNGESAGCAQLVFVLWWPVRQCQSVGAAGFQLATRLGACLLTIGLLAWLIDSLGWVAAVGIQLAMASNAAVEVSALIEHPPLEVADYAVVLIASVIPMLDTVDAAWQIVYEQLGVHAPWCTQKIVAPCVDGIAKLLDRAASLLAWLLWPLTALAQTVNQAINELVTSAMEKKAAILSARAGTRNALVHFAPEASVGAGDR